ncbi:pesticin C-terminus-like muramidase [Pseudomonas sp. Eth.TT006]
MSTGLLEQRQQYRTGYEYGPFKGETDHDNDGKKEIDCSGLLYRMLKDAGYTIPYLTTSGLNTDTTYFDVIPLAEVQPGDIALWINFHGHTGVIEDIFGSPVRDRGNFFGSQSSNGPKSAKYGAGSGYWPMPEKFLRPKPQFRGAQPAPAPAPSPAPAPAGPAPLMSFQYPFRKADGKQFSDADEIYKALENESAGHYLLGSNKFWHGGIHISNASAPQCILNEPIRCMADGEVVAYRLNEDYLKSTFGTGETAKNLDYSSSFCLVRHEYKSAPNPEEGPNKGKQNGLIFYSLYMHLLPYKHYPLAENEKPNPIVTMTVKDFKAYDDFPVSNNFPYPGKLAKHTKLEILEKRSVEDVTYAKGKILSGSVKHGSTKVRDVGQEVWFAYLKNDEPYQNSSHKAIWVADAIPERARPKYWQGKVKAKTTQRLAMYGAPTNLANGQPAGARIENNREITVGSVIEFDSKDVLNLVVGNKLRRMAPCVPVVASIWNDNGAVPSNFWAIIESEKDSQYTQWESLTPTNFDVVTTSVGIKAGDPIGYLGKTENLVNENGLAESKFQVHVEIFTTQVEVKEFLDNVAALKVGRQYLHLPKGAQLKKKMPATGTSEPLKEEHAIDLGKVPVVKEGNEDWYELSVNDEDQPVSGLVKKSDAKVITPHDWTKMGFQLVEESNSASDGFLDPDDMPQFFKDLLKKIDKNHDGKVEPSELADALKSPETRQHWSKLVAHHPTEWKDDTKSEKWKRLDTFLEGSEKLLKHEKERIDSYVFWDKLADKTPAGTGLIYHFHPIGFVSNFLAMEDDNDLKWLKVEKGQLTFDVEGNDIEDSSNSLHMYFSRKAHWPGGASGITIGRGYDLGQKSDPMSDLTAVGVPEPLLSWLVGAKGLSGNAARDYLNNASPEIRKTFITRKQQYKLFVSVYEIMKNKVVTISQQPFNVGHYGTLNWDAVDVKIQDMIVDLIYRGDYKPTTREIVQRPFVENNKAELKTVMSLESNWPGVPAARFAARKNYL